MILNDKLIKKLREIGFNSYEAKIWAALLSRGVSTAGELSDIANVPRSRSYDVLESLEKKGFVVMKIGKPIKYIAVPPQEVLERIKKNIEKETVSSLERLDELRGSDLIEELDMIHKKGYDNLDPTTISGSIKGRQNVDDQLYKLVRESEEEILLVTTSRHLQRKAELLLREFKKAKERGVSIKIASPVAKETEEIKLLREFATLKEVDLKGRFCIVDRKSLLFMLTDGENAQEPALWVNTGLFAQSLAHLFDKAWQVSEKQIRE